MQKHVKRVAGGLVATIAFGTVLLTTDIPKALEQADKSFAFITQSLGAPSPPMHAVTAAWGHPWVVVLVFVAVFVFGVLALSAGEAYLKRLFKPKPTPAPPPAIDVANILYVDSMPITDEWQVAETPLLAVYVALQVSNGNQDGLTLRRVQAHAENEWGDRVALSFRATGASDQAIDIRHGVIEFLDVGFVVTSPEIRSFGTILRSTQDRVAISHGGLNAAMREALMSDFRLYLGVGETMKFGHGTSFRVVVTAEDVPAFRQVFRLNFRAESPYDWLERVETSQ